MNTESFDKLRKQLEQQNWPEVYLYKFIVKNEPEFIARVCALFDDTAEIKFQHSNGDRYVSISAKEMMMDAASVIERYEKASLIKGIIAL
ncbi:MAG: DUF493 family protein [Bacteroidetes bacterium]|nr:MAG: DUF493 family protein [Bacteroidota bacterium]